METAIKNRNELFKDIPGYEGFYQVSNLGRVKSLGNEFTRREKILKQNKNTTGYCQVVLCGNSKNKAKLVHRLVAKCFLGFNPTKRSIIVDHKDNDILNNNVDNLQIITQRLNTSKDRHRQNYSSKYVGVCWVTRDKRWLAQIRIDGKQIYLGSFINELEAANAYQTALKEIKKSENHK